MAEQQREMLEQMASCKSQTNQQLREQVTKTLADLAAVGLVEPQVGQHRLQ